MLLNRVGDFSLLIGIFFIFINFKAVDYSTVSSLIYFFKTTSITVLTLEINSLTAIGIFLFVGAAGKSAQLGLHT